MIPGLHAREFLLRLVFMFVDASKLKFYLKRANPQAYDIDDESDL